MPCDRCGERPAAVHLTQIVHGQVTKQHLSDTCANAAGIQTDAVPGQYPLVDFLSTLGGVGGALPSRTDEEGACVCGATLVDFRETGRLGCAACYDTFSASLRTLLRRIHGASQHMGRLYTAPGAPNTPTGEALRALREQLRHAIEAEDFERAAQLRDSIRGAE
jgi:protein arginine kinase activator